MFATTIPSPRVAELVPDLGRVDVVEVPFNRADLAGVGLERRKAEGAVGHDLRDVRPLRDLVDGLLVGRHFQRVHDPEALELRAAAAEERLQSRLRGGSRRGQRIEHGLALALPVLAPSRRAPGWPGSSGSPTPSGSTTSPSTPSRRPRPSSRARWDSRPRRTGFSTSPSSATGPLHPIADRIRAAPRTAAWRTTKLVAGRRVSNLGSCMP